VIFRIALFQVIPHHVELQLWLVQNALHQGPDGNRAMSGDCAAYEVFGYRNV
jgi:hypothetical protein